MPYPVSVIVDSQLQNRDRLTSALRPILAIPHAIIVGPASWFHRAGGAGLLGAVVYFLAIVSWFTILISGEHFQGIRDLTLYYLRWRTRAIAYMALFADAYPPFGDGAYPASIEVADPPGPRDRVAVGLRILLAVPHIIVLFFVLLAWSLTTIAAWCIILFTGNYPQGLYEFGVGALRWRLRVETYVLLMVDEYPPFSLT